MLYLISTESDNAVDKSVVSDFTACASFLNTVFFAKRHKNKHTASLTEFIQLASGAGLVALLLFILLVCQTLYIYESRQTKLHSSIPIPESFTKVTI